MSSPEGKPDIRVSELFSDCPQDIQLLILSSDNVLFKINHQYLAAHSATFADAGSFPRDAEPVQLTESSTVLEILFQHIYPQPRPKLKTLSNELVLGLAEAAEKYCVYSALDMCQMRLHQIVSLQDTHRAKYALRVLAYACRHNHPELANDAALVSLHESPSNALRVLNNEVAFSWMLYKEHIDKLVGGMLAIIPGIFGHEGDNDDGVPDMDVCAHWAMQREQLIENIRGLPRKYSYHLDPFQSIEQAFNSLDLSAHDDDCYCPISQPGDYTLNQGLLYRLWGRRKPFTSFFFKK